MSRPILSNDDHLKNKNPNIAKPNLLRMRSTGNIEKPKQEKPKSITRPQLHQARNLPVHQFEMKEVKKPNREIKVERLSEKGKLLFEERQKKIQEREDIKYKQGYKDMYKLNKDLLKQVKNLNSDIDLLKCNLKKYEDKKEEVKEEKPKESFKLKMLNILEKTKMTPPGSPLSPTNWDMTE